MKTSMEIMYSHKNMLLEKLVEEFSDVGSLGYENSLLECNYFDSNRWFPSDGTDWVSKVTGLTKENLLSHWSEKEKHILLKEIAMKKNLFRNDHWRSVNIDFFIRHQFGLGYLTTFAFKYYLAAWIYLYISSDEADRENLSEVSDRFFKKLGQGFVSSKDKYWLSMTKDQKLVTSDFFIYIQMISTVDSFKALQALQDGWLDLNQNGKIILRAYNEAKEIDDFING